MTDLFETTEEVKKAIYGDDYDTFTERKFNFAIIRKTENGVTYEEMWILVNAYYDYGHAKFIKIDKYAISLGIQLQAKGNNPGYNFWMCPAWLDSNDNYIVEMDEDYYDYTDMKNEGYIGAEYDNEFWGNDNGTWRTFGIATGWTPSAILPIDSILSSESENPVQNKVINTALSNYVQKSQTNGLLKNDGTVDTNNYLTEHQSLSNYVEKSQTAGLLKNDGTIDTTQYVSDVSGKADASDFDTVEVTINYIDNTTETVELYVVPSNNS